jgi:DNA-binding PadR family transcriptional regulator
MTSGRTRFSLLGWLSRGPKSGYEMARLMADSTEHFWSESPGQIYPSLRALEAEGLVQHKDLASGARRRKCFVLTRAGRAALEQWLAEPPQEQPPRNELLLKVFFGRHGPAAVLRQHLQQFATRQNERMRAYREIATKLDRHSSADADLFYWRLTLEFGLKRVAAAEAWAIEALAGLDSVTPASSGPARPKKRKKHTRKRSSKK